MADPISSDFWNAAYHIPNSFMWETVVVEVRGQPDALAGIRTPLDALGLVLGQAYARYPSFRAVSSIAERYDYERWPFTGRERYVPVHLTVFPETSNRWNAEIVMGADGRLALYFADQSWLSFKTLAGENMTRDDKTILRPGATFIGDTAGEVYVTSDLIGAGGTAHVYSVFRDEERFAAKCLCPGRFDLRELADRFDREVSHLEAVRHPNVIGFVDRAYGDQYLILVMENATESLAQRLTRGRPSLATAAEWVDQILAGVGFLHENDMVHRDLAPKNLLFDEGGTLKVSDFGTVRAALDPDITQVNDAALGSLVYISDEQRRSPHSAEPARNTAMPAMNTGLRPKRSASLPKIGVVTACISR